MCMQCNVNLIQLTPQPSNVAKAWAPSSQFPSQNTSLKQTEHGCNWWMINTERERMWVQFVDEKYWKRQNMGAVCGWEILKERTWAKFVDEKYWKRKQHEWTLWFKNTKRERIWLVHEKYWRQQIWVHLLH